MTGIVDDAAQEPSLRIPGPDYADFRIGGTREADDVRVALAGVGIGQPVLHKYATVEGRVVFQSRSHSATGGDACRAGLANRLGNLARLQLGIARIAGALDRVGVRGAHQNRLRRDAAAFLDLPASG